MKIKRNRLHVSRLQTVSAYTVDEFLSQQSLHSLADIKAYFPQKPGDRKSKDPKFLLHPVFLLM